MTFHEIVREDGQRILGVRACPEGVEFAICQDAAEGGLLPSPHHATVTVPRATRRWIGHALCTLSWNAEDFVKVVNLLRDPRIEMSSSHLARGRTLRMPNHVMPQDGYRQLGSVWYLTDERFAACISDAAIDPSLWGEQIASLMGQIVCANIDGNGDQKAALQIILSGYRDALAQAGGMRHFASRFDWDNAKDSMEVVSLWYSPNGLTLRVVANNSLVTPYFWGIACAALTHEVVETLSVEREEEKHSTFDSLMPAFNAHLKQASLAFKKIGATVQ